jgi:hypothetical protein
VSFLMSLCWGRAWGAGHLGIKSAQQARLGSCARCLHKLCTHSPLNLQPHLRTPQDDGSPSWTALTRIPLPFLCISAPLSLPPDPVCPQRGHPA